MHMQMQQVKMTRYATGLEFAKSHPPSCAALPDTHSPLPWLPQNWHENLFFMPFLPIVVSAHIQYISRSPHLLPLSLWLLLLHWGCIGYRAATLSLGAPQGLCTSVVVFTHTWGVICLVLMLGAPCLSLMGSNRIQTHRFMHEGKCF